MSELMEAVSRGAAALFALCAAAAGMELLVQEGRISSAFRSLCALAVAMMALRLVAGIIGLA